MDAVVIGAGPNGLTAANMLADAGWEVEVLEAASTPGGAVRTGELTVPGFRHDLFSSFYPLGAVSPALRPLDLESYGLRWRRAPLVLAHPLRDGRCAVLSQDLEETCASLDAFHPSDGDGWRRLHGLWDRVGDSLLEAILTPFPPVRAGGKLVRELGRDELLRFVRFALLPVRQLADEEFRGAGGGLLLAGNALHADLAPESTAGGFYGWLLCSLGQTVGFPAPAGGAGELTAALVRRLESRGGRVTCDAPVTRVVVSDGRAVAVRTGDGRVWSPRRGVLADVGARSLYLDLVGAEHLPARLVEDLQRFQYDASTVKVDWALSRPIPWESEPARRAGTVHVAEGMDDLSRHASQLASKRIPDAPFLVMGQYAAFDPTRQPAGAETAWAYTHVPRHPRGDAGPDGLEGTWDERETELFAARMEARIEALAPGFRETIVARHVFTPPTMEATNPNLVAGAINGGTAQIHQQLVLRPTPGLARAETPVDGLFLASASAHPGGGVHGAAGANAARAALRRAQPLTRVAGIGLRAAHRALAGGVAEPQRPPPSPAA